MFVATKRRLFSTSSMQSFIGRSTQALLAPFRPRGAPPKKKYGDTDLEDVFGVDVSTNFDINGRGKSAAFPGRHGAASSAGETGDSSAPSASTSSSGHYGPNGAYNGSSIGSSLAPKPHLQETPTKDRMPPAVYNPRDTRRRLAVLIDGSRVDAQTYASVVEPAVFAHGVPVIVRVFDTELRDGWVELVEESFQHGLSGGVGLAGGVIVGSGGGNRKVDNSFSDSPNKNLEHVSKSLSSSSSASLRPALAPEISKGARLPQIEWFRVDRFIPVNVQIAADAQHIFDFRNGNRVEGVCVVCTESERATRFEKYFDRLKGKGFSQLSFDEKGVATTLIEDNREGDGQV